MGQGWLAKAKLFRLWYIAGPIEVELTKHTPINLQHVPKSLFKLDFGHILLLDPQILLQNTWTHRILSGAWAITVHCTMVKKLGSL